MHQNRLAAGLRPDPLVELERSTRHPSRIAVGAMEGDTLQPQLGCFAARKGGRWKYVEGAEMNEKRYFQIRQRFRLQVKMHIWRPGFARTR